MEMLTGDSSGSAVARTLLVESLAPTPPPVSGSWQEGRAMCPDNTVTDLRCRSCSTSAPRTSAGTLGGTPFWSPSSLRATLLVCQGFALAALPASCEKFARLATPLPGHRGEVSAVGCQALLEDARLPCHSEGQSWHRGAEDREILVGERERERKHKTRSKERKKSNRQRESFPGLSGLPTGAPVHACRGVEARSNCKEPGQRHSVANCPWA